MARRHIWQALLGWFKAGDQEDSAVLGGMAFALPPSPMTSDEAVDAGIVFDAPAAIFADDELLEFLEADADPVPVDPEFRERLREQLWDMVQDGVTALPKDH